MIALAGRRGLGYDIRQVLITLNVAVPRTVNAIFLCLSGFAPMRGGLVRKAGRPSTFGLSTPLANALISVARSLECRSKLL
jgi:hypothetical protein